MAAPSPALSQSGFTPAASVHGPEVASAVQLRPTNGHVGAPVRVILRLPSSTGIAAFRIFFGEKEADSQVATEEHLNGYERIVLVAPVPQQERDVESTYVIVQRLDDAGKVVDEVEAGDFSYTGNDTVPTAATTSLHVRRPSPLLMDAEFPRPRMRSATSHVPRPFLPPEAVKAGIRFAADLNDMTRGWTAKEWSRKRRLVQFWRQQEANIINATFRPVSPIDYTPDAVIVSCIYREETDDCFITSIDLLHLLQALLGCRLTSEEKARVRRKLESYKPLTVSRHIEKTRDFHSLIMAFGRVRGAARVVQLNMEPLAAQAPDYRERYQSLPVAVAHIGLEEPYPVFYSQEMSALPNIGSTEVTFRISQTPHKTTNAGGT